MQSGEIKSLISHYTASRLAGKNDLAGATWLELSAAIDALEKRAEKAEAELMELKTQQATGVAGPTVTLMNERRTT